MKTSVDLDSYFSIELFKKINSFLVTPGKEIVHVEGEKRIYPNC